MQIMSHPDVEENKDADPTAQEKTLNHDQVSQREIQEADEATQPEYSRGQSTGRLSVVLHKYTGFVHLAGWVLITAWWIAGLVLHHGDKNWIVPFLLWLCSSLRLLLLHVPVSVVWQPVQWLWTHTIVTWISFLPVKVRMPGAAALTFILIITVALTEDESGENNRANRAVALFGLAFLLSVLWATSRNRKKIQWQRVIIGILAQFIIALFVLRSSTGYNIFSFVSDRARDLLGYAGNGAAFLTDASFVKMPWFLIAVVPPIIFFVALVQLLYHYGLLQWLLRNLAVFFSWAMSVSGAEALAAAACPFVGQGENAVLIGPLVVGMSNAEIHQIMCSGFSTIAGSVLGAYIALGVDPYALISSCVMSIPASLVISHLRYPEPDGDLTEDPVRIPDAKRQSASNGLQAFSDGAWLGLKVAGMIVATVLCVVALLALINAFLTWAGHYINLDGQHDLTIELVVGYICYPIAFLLGVPRNHELLLVARLIGMKVITNEFVAYTALVSKAEYVAMSHRSKIIATYALCGFGNLSAVGIQIGVLSQIAPSRSRDISKIASSALLAGILSTLSSASIAGLLLKE